MKILTLENRILRENSAMVGDINGELLDFLQAMLEVMHSGSGIGLAAVQVGQLIRVFVTHVPKDVPRIFINPQIIATSLEENIYEEGCLSIPGVNAEIIRPRQVRIQAWNEKAKPFTLEADGILATCVQHELDHLNGKLFIDHLDPKKKERVLKSYYDTRLKV